MSEDMALGAGHWFDKGTEATKARQWDYAVECLSSAVSLSPDTLKYRQTKHRACRRRQKYDPSRLSTVKLVDIRRKLLQARVAKNWSGMDKWAEAGLAHQPMDPQFFAQIATACSEMGRTEVAHYAWSTALKLDRANVDYNRAFGRFLCMQHEYDTAQKCFRRILEKDPDDRYAAEMLRYIDVERLIHKRGYGGAESTKDAQPEDAPQTASGVSDESSEGIFALDVGGVFDLAEDGNREATDAASSARQKTHQLRHAKLCAEQRRWDMCMQAYRKALKFDPDNTSIRELMENAELSMMRENVEQLQRAAKREVGFQRLQIEAQDMERLLIERRIEVYSVRARRYRGDMAIRFDLAEDLSRIGDYQKAIPLYQQACQNLNLREQALLKLGQCWICDGKKDLARRQFALALKTLTARESPDAWKTAHYWLGRLSEADGATTEAESHYSEVLLLDYGFRDTVSRLEAVQGDAVPQDA